MKRHKQNIANSGDYGDLKYLLEYPNYSLKYEVERKLRYNLDSDLTYQLLYQLKNKLKKVLELYEAP